MFRKERHATCSDLPTETWLIEATLTLAKQLGVHVNDLASLGASIEYILPGSVAPGIESDDKLVVLWLNGSVVALCQETLDEWGWVCTDSRYFPEAVSES